MIGTTPISGEYHGVAEVVAKLGPLLSRLTAPPPKITFSEIIVDGDRVVMLASAIGEGLRGTTYRQPYYAFVARVRGDGFSELVEFSDTAMVEYAFFGKTLVD